MTPIDLVGTSGVAASVLPVEAGLALWILVATLMAGAVGISLASMPPSTLLRRIRVPRLTGPSRTAAASV